MKAARFKLRMPWDQTATPAQRRASYLVAFGGLAFILVAGAATYRFGQPIYLRWKSERAVRQARAALTRHDLAETQMSLRVAMNAGLSQDGYAALAEYYESVGSPLAIGARRELLQQQPHDLNARLALISAALRFHDSETAAKALNEADKSDLKDPRLRSGAIMLAMQTGQLPLAHALLDQLHASQPNDPTIRLARAEVIIHHPDAKVATEGRQELIALTEATGPAQVAATRVLLRDAMARRDVGQCRRWADRLALFPAANLGDLLNASDGRHLPNLTGTAAVDQDLKPRIEALARADLGAAEEYARWLVVRGRGAEAGPWLDSLDPALVRDSRLVALRAEVAESAGQWDDLEARLAAGAWGPFPPAAVRLTFAAHALAAHGQAALALRTFEGAVDQARSSANDLWYLTSLAQTWNWPAAADVASAAEVHAFPKDPRPYPRWVAHLRSSGSSADLRDGLDGWRKADPRNLEARYNWALVSLLVRDASAAGTTRPPPEAVKVMEDFYQSDRNNPLYITGAAFARFRTGQIPSAAALLAELKPVATRRPERAPYLAAILAAAGRYPEARAYLKGAPNVTLLLPEERQLLQEASAEAGG